MNEKLSLQDLVDLLSKKAKITKKDADSFFREFFQLILERIFDNDFVKVKDFGTFKLISVSSRESVNVNTGEKIEIPSHYKLSFIPDKILKNLVNKPFSQFETILLEDGVVFEASVEDEEDVTEEDVFENTELDLNVREDAVVEDTSKLIENTAASIDSNIKSEVKDNNTELPDPQKSKTESPINKIYSRSFVYTYTTSGSNQKSDSITLTVPKDDLKGSVSILKTEDKPSSLEEKEVSIELKDLPSIPVINSSLSENKDKEESLHKEEEERLINSHIGNELSETSPIEEIQPKSVLIDKIEPLISLTKKGTRDVDLESDLDSEIETEEDVIIPVRIVDKSTKEKEIQEEQSVSVQIPDKKDELTFSNEDPERPLFPLDEDEAITDVDFIPYDKDVDTKNESIEKDRNIVGSANSQSYVGNNKPTEIRSVSYSDTIDPVDIPFGDYDKPTLGTKLKKILPIVLFFMVIIGCLAYGLVKMLTKPYDFEYNLGRTNLSLSDTLPLVDEVSVQAQTTDALLDSMKRVQTNQVSDTIKEQPAAPSVKKVEGEQAVVPAKSNLTGSADSLTTALINAEKNSFVISDKLQFGIINKAEYHLLKYAVDGKDKAVNSSAQRTSDVKKISETSKAQYATIKRGTTLRTMATTYYGNPYYWVYIYQANKKNIANPNNVPIGTRLLIPSLAEYGISNPKDPKSIQAAKKLEAKIVRE